MNMDHKEREREWEREREREREKMWYGTFNEFMNIREWMNSMLRKRFIGVYERRKTYSRH